MASRAIKPKRDLGGDRSSWQELADRAPSIVREEGPLFARYVAVFSLMLITLGGASLLFHAWGGTYKIPSGWGFIMLTVGMGGLLYHAFNEKDFQFRRLYGAFGFLLIVAGVFLRVAPIGREAGGGFGGSFLPYGALGMLLSLGFLLAFSKNETEATLRGYLVLLIGLAAVANALTGIIGGVISERFLGQTGIIHLVLGLLFAMGYIGMEGFNSRRGYWAGCGIGIFGLAMFLVALYWSLLPELYVKFSWSGTPPASFFLPSGLILMYIGVEYMFVYLGICSDSKLIVLTRRELGAFFSSPIIYIVMIGMAVVGWLNFTHFVNQLQSASMRGMSGGPIPEPIFFLFMVSFLFIIPLIFLVPIVTMRMLSEEKRAGTLEMVLTAPVNEWQVVVAKFLAGVRVFLLCWYLWGAFLIALWVEGGPFDYRPVVTFWLALCCLAANFIAMGLFFSSVTRHQILAAVLTFVVMMVLTLIFMLTQFIGEAPWLSFLLTYVSYIDLWISSARSTITPRLLLLNLSVAVFWLFLTIKVLEARKWA